MSRCETNSEKYEYFQMEHDEFIEVIWFAMKKWMKLEDFDNQYSQLGLKFIARLTVSNSKDSEHRIPKSICDKLLNITSPEPIIRQFICHFLDLLVRYSKIMYLFDEEPIDKDRIATYLLPFIDDHIISVRVQAVLALTHFQRNQEVQNKFIEHLNCDPSPKVRRNIIKWIHFTDESVPHILERLLDVNEHVRCAVYSDLSQRDVRQLTIAQRLSILNHGYNDQSTKVQDVIVNQLVLSWFRMYNNNMLELLKAIKFDANFKDIENFMRISKYMLFNWFEKYAR